MLTYMEKGQRKYGLKTMGSIISLCAAMLLCGCARHYTAFQYDNSDDYPSEGLYRIVDRKGRIGYADKEGKTAIHPRFAFGYPFEGGRAKVTDSGQQKEVPGSGGEYHYWESDGWYYIDRNGNRLPDYRLLRSIRYAYRGDSIMVTDGADKEQCAGIHEHIILPLLTELAHTLGGSEEAERMANEAGYSDVRYYLDMPGTAADSQQAGNTWITVDILSFDSGNPDFKRCLNVIKEKDYHAVEWVSEAPEQCLVLIEGGELVVVWCSLFHDGKEAVQKVRKILEPLTVDSPKYKEQTEGH